MGIPELDTRAVDIRRKKTNPPGVGVASDNDCSEAKKKTFVVS